MVRTWSKRDGSVVLDGFYRARVPVKISMRCSLWIRTEN